MKFTNIFLLLTSVLPFALASPTPEFENTLEARQAPDNIVSITSTTNFCMIVPRDVHTDVGDSEHPGGMTTYCSATGQTSPGQQGLIPDDFWSEVALESGTGSTGKKWIQLTGCIRPETVDRLNPSDYGGQYDSSGGDGGQGNPQGSKCLGYSHYVELVEPAGRRACIRCCDEFNDCPVNKDTQGCPEVIEGNYFNCG